jgi:hypothetical protein
VPLKYVALQSKIAKNFVERANERVDIRPREDDWRPDLENIGVRAGGADENPLAPQSIHELHRGFRIGGFTDAIFDHLDAEDRPAPRTSPIASWRCANPRSSSTIIAPTSRALLTRLSRSITCKDVLTLPGRVVAPSFSRDGAG